MSDKKEEDARPKQGRILRAKDIIPGAEQDIRISGNQDIRESGGQDFGVPQFNLAQDILSVQRRQSAFRRKGPEETEDQRQRTEDRGRKTENSGQKMVVRHLPSVIRHPFERDTIIVEIVARDIERLFA
jgi:hypothetical protein